VLGSFTLEDMLAQVRMIQKLGPMKKVLGMMPGLSGFVDQIDTDDRRVRRMEALFTSMTPRERLHPDLLDMSRRRRIARGAGQDVGAVNELLKSFKAMKQMMKQMNKLGLGARLGAQEKRRTLEGLSPDGALAAPGGGGGGLFGGLGNLAGGLGNLAGGLGDLAGGLGRGIGGLGGLLGGGSPGLPDLGGGARAMGRSPTRKSGGSKKKRKDRKKRRR
jgi:signal recognition particle subunit SRP54